MWKNDYKKNVQTHNDAKSRKRFEFLSFKNGHNEGKWAQEKKDVVTGTKHLIQLIGRRTFHQSSNKLEILKEIPCY